MVGPLKRNKCGISPQNGNFKGEISEETFHPTFMKLLGQVKCELEDSEIFITNSFGLVCVKLVILDPLNDFRLQSELDESEFTRLRKILVDRIKSLTPEQRSIIEMQLYYRENFFKPSELCDGFRVEQDKELCPLLDDLVNNPVLTMAKNSKSDENLELFYQKLVAVIIIRADMGSPSNALVTKLTEIALESVFPKQDVYILRGMTIEERIQEIGQLMAIIMGIRIFNKYINPVQMSEGIENIIEELPCKVSEVWGLLQEMKNKNIQRVILYTTIAKPYHLLSDSDKKIYNYNYKSAMNVVKQGLVMTHQILININELIGQLEDEECGVSGLIEAHLIQIKDLDKTIGHCMTMPPSAVYTKFIGLSQSWDELKNSQYFIEMIMGVSVSLLNFTEPHLSTVDHVVEQIVQNSPTPVVLPSVEEFFACNNTNTCTSDIDKIPPQDLKSRIGRCFPKSEKCQIDPTPQPSEIQFGGFCLWTLVQGHGLLCIANPGLTVRLHNKSYPMSSARAYAEFREKPQEFVRKAVEMAKTNPELIFLLNLQNLVFSPADGQMRKGYKSNKLLEMGLLRKDLNIEGRPGQNCIWTLKDPKNRELIRKLEKIKNCRTHSTQTVEGDGDGDFMTDGTLKKSSETQTYLKVHAESQTRRDAYVDVPQSQYFYYGLRGCSTIGPHLIELSRENLKDYPQITPTKHKGKIQDEIAVKNES